MPTFGRPAETSEEEPDAVFGEENEGGRHHAEECQSLQNVFTLLYPQPQYGALHSPAETVLEVSVAILPTCPCSALYRFC